MLDRFLQDYVLEPWLDTYEEPSLSVCSAALVPPRQNGTLIACKARPYRPIVARRSRGMQTGDYAEPCWMAKLPLEVLESIVETAALSAMVDDEQCVSAITVDCLRPEAGVQSLMDTYPFLTARFHAVCKNLSLVSRLFRSLVIPMLWREPYFSREAKGFDAFLALLPTTTAVSFSPGLAPAKPYWTYVKTIATFGSSLFHRNPSLLVTLLPHLQNLETLRFGASSADMPLSILEQMSCITPRSIRRLPDVLMHPKEKPEEASRRLSAVLSIAARCEELECVDVVWGHSLLNQLGHLLFALQLQALHPDGIRPVALRSLSFNEQCSVSLAFLDELPRVAPNITSLHFEIGSRVVRTSTSPLKTLDLPAFVNRLPYLESFSFTPTTDVCKIGNFDDILVTHPRMRCLQLFINDFDMRRFFIPLTLTATPALKCLCIATSTDNLSTLLVLRRPWRLRKMAPLVLHYVDMMGQPHDEQMKLDIIRKADLMTLPKGTRRVNYD